MQHNHIPNVRNDIGCKLFFFNQTYQLFILFYMKCVENGRGQIISRNRKLTSGEFCKYKPALGTPCITVSCGHFSFSLYFQPSPPARGRVVVETESSGDASPLSAHKRRFSRSTQHVSNDLRRTNRKLIPCFPTRLLYTVLCLITIISCIVHENNIDS